MKDFLLSAIGFFFSFLLCEILYQKAYRKGVRDTITMKSSWTDVYKNNNSEDLK